MHQRAEEGERLMDWAFANFEDVTLFTAGDVIERVPVWLGTRRRVPLVGGRDLVVTMPRNWRQERVGDGGLRRADPRAGAEGHDARQADGGGPGVPGMEVPLLAGADVAKLGLPGRAMAVLSHYVTGGCSSDAAGPLHHARGRRGRRQDHPGPAAGRGADGARPAVLRTREPGGAPGAEFLREPAAAAALDWSRRPRPCCTSPPAPSMSRRPSARRWRPACGWCATASPIPPWPIRATARAPTARR